MDRLISADKIREDWLRKGQNEKIYDTDKTTIAERQAIQKWVSDFLVSIDEQPTAYYVEKVKDAINAKIKKLDEMSDCYEKFGCQNDADRFRQIALAWREAFTIVQKGGKHE